MKEDLRKKFDESLKKWEDHIEKNSFMSDTLSYLECDAFEELAKMGKGILPFIREEYGKPFNDQDMRSPGRLWGYLIYSVEPAFRLKIGEKGSKPAITRVAPGFIGTDIKKLREEVLEWLDKYLAKQKKG